MKNCSTCKYSKQPLTIAPCKNCAHFSLTGAFFHNWEPEEDQQSKKEQVSILDYVDNKSGVI